MTAREPIKLPDAETRTSIRKLDPDRRHYLADLEKEYRQAWKDLGVARTQLAAAAKDYSVWPGKLAGHVQDVLFKEGFFQASMHYYEVALVRALHRGDATVEALHLRVVFHAQKRLLQVCGDDSTSGRGNDNSRVVRDGWLRYVERLAWLYSVPTLHEGPIQP